MEYSEIKKLSDEQLAAEVKAARVKLFNLRVQRETEKVENTAQFGELKKLVARLLTEANVRRYKKNPGLQRKPKIVPAAKPKSIRQKAKRPGGAKAHKPKKVKPAAAKG